MAGTFYAVSVGPGDSEFLTLKAINILKSCRVIAVPVSSGKATALAIAEEQVDMSGKEIIEISMPMSKDKKALSDYRKAAAERIEGYLQSENAAMITLGDVSVYSGAYYIFELIGKHGYSCRMIPGVTSFCAAAAELGISLSEADEELHIIPASCVSAEEALELKGTKVLMKCGREYRSVINEIEKRNLQKSSSMVTNCGMDGELKFETLEAPPENAGYFTTIIVKE